jgi:succinylarginine dihydrolase
MRSSCSGDPTHSTSPPSAFLADEGGAEHDRLRGEAEAAGVFGVPTFVFDGELFWGGDRIGLLRERLDEKSVKRRRSGGTR